MDALAFRKKNNCFYFTFARFYAGFYRCADNVLRSNGTGALRFSGSVFGQNRFFTLVPARYRT